MNLKKGFHKEVIEAKESSSNIEHNKNSLKHKIDNTPLNAGGASFKTHVLLERSSSKFAYRPTVFAILFCLLFIVVGLGLSLYQFYPFFLNENFEISNINWSFLIGGFVFSIGGSFFLYYFSIPKVFDKQLGVYYKGYNSKDHRVKKQKEDKYIPLKSIVAFQIIGEYVTSSDSTYKSFELNLVLSDGTRRNVIDHGNLKSVVKDAEVLSKFLNIPIWHATSHLD